MIIKINDDYFRISFHHERKPIAPHQKRGKKEQEWTSCLMEKIDPDSRRVLWVIDEQRAYCSLHDNFSKSEGRRRSLTRALAGFPREQRKQAWAAIWEARRKVTDEPWSL